MSNPTEFLRQMQDDAAREQAARFRQGQLNRAAALAKAREARRASAVVRAEAEAKREYCVHPADDHWTERCRTLCGNVRNADYVLAPSAVSRALKPVCQHCLGVWSRWRLFGSGKPLTFRRLNTFKEEEREMAELIEAVAKNTVQMGTLKTRREAALENALQVLFRAEMDAGLKSVAADMMIGLIQAEADLREGKPDDDGRAATARRVWHVELVRMNLPKEVLAALKGA